MSRLLSGLAILLCLAWAGAVAYAAWSDWPHLSLDLSAEDASTQAALQRAVFNHVAAHAAAALGPLIIVAVVAGLLTRSGSRSDQL